MSDIVLEQCSKYYPTNPIFIFQHNVRHCIERSYMYVRNSQKNVSQSNPIFNFHDNVKPVVDESPPIWQHRVPIEGWVFYRRRLVVHTQTEVSCVLLQEFSTGTASPFWLDACGSVQLTWAHVISSFIQTIIQPFPNARRQLPSCIPSWLEANIGRVFDPKESSGHRVSRRLDTVQWPGLEPTACKNMYYYGAKQWLLCHMAQWKRSLITREWWVPSESILSQ